MDYIGFQKYGIGQLDAGSLSAKMDNARHFLDYAFSRGKIHASGFN